jgi:glycosyltransferase involved in cell wall biosynthesis
MKILYIWDADYPWDVRVEKICTSLSKHGNEVHIAARNLKKKPSDEKLNGLQVHRLKSWRNDRMNYICSFPAFFNPFWRRHLDDIIAKNRIELIIVRDLPMAIAGIWAGRRNGIPVVMDMAENYVSMIRDIWKMNKFKGLNVFVRNPYFAELVEKYALKRMDHILVVVTESGRGLLQRGIQSDRFTLIGNTPSPEIFEKQQVTLNRAQEMIQSRFSAVYTGGIQLGRGIQVVFDAIPKVREQIPDFLFVVIGDGYATAQLKKIIEDKGLQEHVMWIGWVDHRELYTYIRVCRIGLIPHLVSDHVNTTIPNKIFDYMGWGLPVIASNAVPMKRIIEEESCGVTFESGDSHSLADAIIGVHRSEVDYGKNGSSAVTARYNWKKDEERLLRVVDRFRRP